MSAIKLPIPCERVSDETIESLIARGILYRDQTGELHAIEKALPTTNPTTLDTANARLYLCLVCNN